MYLYISTTPNYDILTLQCLSFTVICRFILHVPIVRLVLGVHFEDSRWRVGPHGHDSRHEDHRSHRRRRQQPGCVETCADTQSSVSAAAEE